jgi:hypothetical protein
MRSKHWLTGLALLGMVTIIGWSNLEAQPGGPANGKRIVERVPSYVPDDAPVVKPLPGASEKIYPPITIDPSEPSREPARLIPQPIRFADPQPKIEAPVGKLEDFEAQRAAPVATPDPAPRASAPAPSVANASTQPAVAIDWSGPGVVKVGQPTDYTLTVRNTSVIPVQKVIVQVRTASGAVIAATEPRAEANDGVLLWELGNLLAKQERKLVIKMSSPQRGDLSCQAWVTFTGSSVMKVQAREPKLVVKMQAPEKVILGEPVNVVMTVSNPGDHAADQVKIAASLGEGLETIRGNRLNYDIGALAPGDTRTLTVPCIAKAVGPQTCEATAQGDGNLQAADKTVLTIIQPRLDLAFSGPKLRYLDRKAVYSFKVTNPGDAAASNVFLMESVPVGFKFVSAENGGQYDEETRTIKWFLGEIAPAQAKEVRCELLAIAQGEFTHKAVAHGARGMKSEQELRTAVEGLSAILMEVVDVEDPVEVGGETAYEIKITNTGSKAEGDVKLVCSIPPQMKLKSIAAPVKYEVVGNEVQFQSLSKLSPRADVVFRVVVIAETKGDARFKASLTTATLVEPVIKVEPTKVYAD